MELRGVCWVEVRMYGLGHGSRVNAMNQPSAWVSGWVVYGLGPVAPTCTMFYYVIGLYDV